MNKNPMSIFVATIIALLGATISSGAFADFTVKRIVRCDKGMNVQDVLDKNFLGMPMDLRLVGPCEDFNIQQDDVSIEPLHNHDCPGATVHGGIIMDSVHRVYISCLAVTAGEDGIAITGGNDIELEDMEIYGNPGLGIIVDGGGSVGISGGSISNNGEGISVEGGSVNMEGTDVIGNEGTGVFIDKNSALSFVDGTISMNGGIGIRVKSSSSLNLELSQVSDNTGSGLIVDSGSNAYLAEADIIDNGRSGIAILENSSVRSNGGTFSGNTMSGIFLSWHSTARLFGGAEGGPSIENNFDGIKITTASAVHVGSSAIIPGNLSSFAVECTDEESSVRIDAPEWAIATVECTGFDN